MLRRELIRQFDIIGARVMFEAWSSSLPEERVFPLSVAVCDDDIGAYFDIRIDSVLVTVDVLECDRTRKRLTMTSRVLGRRWHKSFVCGFDEEWYVASLPEVPLTV